MEIRPFAASDQPAARRLILEGLGGHFGFIDETLNPDLDDIHGSYVATGNLFVVAAEDGEVVGTGALVKEGERSGRLVRMSVSAAHRRKGIGKRLVTYLMMVATYRGYDELLIETNRDWLDAIGLYRSMGFVEYDRDQVSVYMRMTL